LILQSKETMTWRVATQPGKTLQEVIDPKDWDTFSTSRQQTYQSVSEFRTEQEADKFANSQVELMKPVRPKFPKQ
jgi:hypothetical protein